ncbi:MAG TPA: phosphotyrosine protein phosphatase [Allosphingosinicella sp.]
MASRAALAGALYRRATTGPAFIQARYGTARGLIRLLLARLDQLRGRYRRFEAVDWRRVERLVFVCTGNICRSPYAERRAAGSGFPAASAALRGGSGQAADAGAQAAAIEAGLSLQSHSSLSVEDAGIKAGDLLVAMEPWQAWRLAEMFAEAPEVQVTLLGLWSSPRRPHLHDPFSLSPEYFRTCFKAIDSGVANLLARVRK